jgi:hypothetical protein
VSDKRRAFVGHFGGSEVTFEYRDGGRQGRWQGGTSIKRVSVLTKYTIPKLLITEVTCPESPRWYGVRAGFICQPDPRPGIEPCSAASLHATHYSGLLRFYNTQSDSSQTVPVPPWRMRIPWISAYPQRLVGRRLPFTSQLGNRFVNGVM